MITLLSIVGFIISISILVTFHEFGHYWVAKKLGVKVLCFSVGFGKPLYSWQGKNGVKYQIASIPLGGYVKMLDERETPDIPPDELNDAFNRKPLYIRNSIIAAGPIANFLLAVGMLFLTFMIGVTSVRPLIGEVVPESPAAQSGILPGDEIIAVNQQSVIGWRQTAIAILDAGTGDDDFTITLKRESHAALHIATFNPSNLDLLGDDGLLSALGIKQAQPHIPPVIAEIIVGGSAERSGLLVNDRITMFNQESVSDWIEVVEKIQENANRTLEIVIERDGGLVNLSLQIDGKEENGKLIGKIGARTYLNQDEMSRYQVFIQHPPLEAFNKALYRTWELSTLTLKILWKMLLGDASLKNISGPLTIAKFAGESIASGISVYLSMLALLSVSIGILNLLPIPMLDGGHLLYNLVEFIKGSPPSAKTQIFGQVIGILLLGSLMFLALYNDVYHLLLS